MMAFGKFAEGTSMFSTTPVENLFMLEFMPHASGDFVRVYLYGLMTCYHQQLAGSIEDVAKALNLEVDTVLNAFRYWEREGLVVRLSDNPPQYAFHTCQEAMNARPQIDKDYYENRDFTAGLQNLFGAEMLLHPKEYTMASDWVEVMHLPQDVVLCMVKNELDKRGKKRTLQTIFRRLDQTAIELANREIRTVDAAQRYFDFDAAAEQCARAVVKKLGFKRNPTEPEQDMVAKWMYQWNMTQDAILEACAKTVNSGNPNFRYLDAILDGMRSDDGSRTDADMLRARAEAEDSEFQQLKAILQEMGQRNPTPTPADREIFEGVMQAGFEYEVVLTAARTGRKRTMEDLQIMLVKWAEQGLFTMEAYEQFRQKRALLDQLLVELFDRAGMDRQPRQADRLLMEKWQKGHSMQMILLAGDMSRGTDTPMRYIDAMLARWEKDGVTTPEAAQRGRTAAPKTETPREAGNFSQREYKKEDFANGFFVEFDPDEEESE